MKKRRSKKLELAKETVRQLGDNLLKPVAGATDNTACPDTNTASGNFFCLRQQTICPS